MMKKLVIGSVALAISVALSAPVQASVIDWTLEGVTFDDGGTASGTFSIDTSTGDLVSYDITTTAGSTLGGMVYDPSTAPSVGYGNYGQNSFLVHGGGHEIHHPGVPEPFDQRRNRPDRPRL
jgi:hypothetical protein